MNGLAIGLFFAVALTAFAAVKFVSDRSAQTILSRWAENAGITLTASTPELFHFGPFWLRWRSQVVLHFEGVHSDGTPVRGYALCGDALFGPLSGDDIKIKFL